MANVLSVCTYPVSVPRHGGQIRIDAIHQIYRAAGHNVRHLAVFRSDFYPEEPATDWNLHFTWPFINDLLATNGRMDVNAADFILKDASMRERVLDLMLSFDPDIIQLEHCWMWPIVKMLRETSDRLRRALIVYSSQNVEHQLLTAFSISDERMIWNATVEAVQQMEMDLVSNADLVVAVTEADAQAFRSKARRLVIAKNGISPGAPGTGSDYWSRELHGRKVALFVGSAHPPNASGFMGLLGPSFGYLSPTEVIVVAGGVCNLLRADKSFRENLGMNLARAMLVGVQDPGGLSTLIEMADVILVPISHGGGTNIKMAEALYNRKPVICTPKATRGYEDYLDMSFVMVRDTADDFKSALTETLRSGLSRRPSISRPQAKRLESLLWPSTLSRLEKTISELVSLSRPFQRTVDIRG